ncbi:MAG: class I SAM-dependent methyltransferase [Candidatus Aminicenantaceae bacterium]
MRKNRSSIFIILIFLSVVFLSSTLAISQTVGHREKAPNEGQPPQKVMDAIGVKPGMVIGEVGAGRGRYTVHLAMRVGETGKIFANDINERALGFLRERCERDGIENVETVLGKVDDPLFPKGTLDMVIMVWVYHHLDKPIEMMKNLIPSLKPGATVVIIDPDPEVEGEKDSHRPTTKASVEQEVENAGFELIRVETFLPKDNIFILRVKTM